MPGNQNFSMSKSFTIFMTYFGLPWIWRWDLACDFQNKIPRLKRIFFFKWWKTLDSSQLAIIEQIKLSTKAYQDSIPKSAIPDQSGGNPFIRIQFEIKRQNLDISDKDLLVKCMEYMKDQFLQSMETNVKDDVSMISTASQDKDHDKDEDDPNNAFIILAGESQDPDNNDGSLGDFWDSITDIIANKVECDKAWKGKAKAKDV
ncbi:hypothetical protein ACSBR1_016926 [Camellia fascicularis]